MDLKIFGVDFFDELLFIFGYYSRYRVGKVVLYSGFNQDRQQVGTHPYCIYSFYRDYLIALFSIYVLPSEMYESSRASFFCQIDLGLSIFSKL